MCIWTTISAISSVVTCLAFILYLVGHIWVIIKNKNSVYEEFSPIPFDSKTSIEDEDNVLIVDDQGSEFSLKSDYGIKKIKIYKVVYDIQDNGELIAKSKSLKTTFDNLNTDKLFIRCDLGEYIPTTQFEIRRTDYTKITFDIYESGKNGHIITDRYTHKLTLMSILYYLCV